MNFTSLLIESLILVSICQSHSSRIPFGYEWLSLYTAPGVIAGYNGAALELVYDFGSLLGTNNNPSQLDIKGIVNLTNEKEERSSYSLRFRS